MKRWPDFGEIRMPAVLDGLRAALRVAAVRLDTDTRKLVASALWSSGAVPVAVIPPADAFGVVAAVRATAAQVRRSVTGIASRSHPFC